MEEPSENHMFKKVVIILKQERNTKKNQKKEKENEYFANNKIIPEKNQDLEKERLTQRIHAETVSQNSQQLHALKTKTTITNSKLETHKNRERHKAKVKDYRSRLGVFLQDHDQSQLSKRDLDLTLQKTREELFHMQEEMNFHMATLQSDMEILSQKQSKLDSKCCNLETEIHHCRDMLQKTEGNASVLEDYQRHISQTPRDQEKMQEETMLLWQQPHGVLDQDEYKEMMVMTSHEQLEELVKRTEKQSEKKDHSLQERVKEVTSECRLLKDRVYQCEKAAREVSDPKDKHFSNILKENSK